MNSWQGMLSGCLGIIALVGAGVWHAGDPQVQHSPVSSVEDAGSATTPLPQLTVSRVCWSADGREILSLSRGGVDMFGRLALHDTSQTNNRLALDFIGEKIECASLARDGLHVLFGTGSGELVWMDVQSAEPIPLLQMPALTTFTATAIADDGQRLAGATNTGTIYVGDPAGKDFMILTSDRKSSVADLRFSPDGERLLSAHHDGRIIVWNLATGNATREFTGHALPAMAAAFLSDGNQIISAGLDDTLRIWDQASGREVCRRELDLAGIKTMTLSPDGATAACGGFARKIVVWDLARGEKKFEISAPASIVFHLSFSPDGTSLAAAGVEGMIRLYDAQTGTEQQGIEINSPNHR